MHGTLGHAMALQAICNSGGVESTAPRYTGIGQPLLGLVNSGSGWGIHAGGYLI